MIEEHQRPPSPEGAVIGAAIILLGIVLLLDQVGIITWNGLWSFWPFALIIGGLVKLSRPQEGRREGGWLVFIGVWLLINEMHVLRYGDSWPLFLVALGVSIIWKALV